MKSGEFKIEDMIKECQDMFSFQMDMKHLQALTDIDPELEQLTLIADAQRIKQIIINLVSNAMKFTFSGYIKIGVKLLQGSRRLNLSL